MKNTNQILKGASVLLIAAVMILSTVAVTANTNEQKEMKDYVPVDIKTTGSSSDPLIINGVFSDSFEGYPDFVVDDFLPFSNKHMDAILAVRNKYKSKIVLFNIFDEERSPWSSEVAKNIISKVNNEYHNTVVGFHLIQNDSIEEIVNTLYPDYRLKSLSANSSRIRDYVLYLDFLKNKKNKLNVDKDFSMLPLDYDTSIVMKALINDDYNTFKQNTPEFMHTFYIKLRSSMSSRQER